VKPATAIPSPEKFLDPPAHSMDLPVPYTEPRQRSLLIFAHTAVVSMRHAWRAGFREYRVSKIRCPIGIAGEDFARIIGKSLGPALPSLTLAGVIKISSTSAASASAPT